MRGTPLGIHFLGMREVHPWVYTFRIWERGAHLGIPPGMGERCTPGYTTGYERKVHTWVYPGMREWYTPGYTPGMREEGTHLGIPLGV